MINADKIFNSNHNDYYGDDNGAKSIFINGCQRQYGDLHQEVENAPPSEKDSTCNSNYRSGDHSILAAAITSTIEHSDTKNYRPDDSLCSLSKGTEQGRVVCTGPDNKKLSTGCISIYRQSELSLDSGAQNYASEARKQTGKFFLSTAINKGIPAIKIGIAWILLWLGITWVFLVASSPFYLFSEWIVRRYFS
jgi:hypothetical protein